MDHLVQTTHMHRVKHWLDNHDLPGWDDIHTLLLVHADVAIFPSIDPIDSEGVILSVILITLDLEGARERLVFDFGQTRALFFHFAMARPRDEIA